MGINFKQWQNRVASRSDLTGRVTHLTKPTGIISKDTSFEELNIMATDNLIKILQEKRLIGSTTNSGYIIGERRAVCFQDTPLYALAQNVEYERNRRESGVDDKLRYCGIGLSFVKADLFHYYNGRPVIYEQTEKAKQFLPKNEWWRIVNYDFRYNQKGRNIIDWTHEREWRVPDDMEFEFNKGFVQVILYSPECVKYFLKNCPSEIVDKIYGITTLKSILM